MDFNMEPEAPKTTQRGRWTQEEHEKFLEGLEALGKDWKRISELMGNRTVIQVRSHAQKHFVKQQQRTNYLPKEDSRPESEIVPQAAQFFAQYQQAWLYHTMKAAQYFQFIQQCEGQRRPSLLTERTPAKRNNNEH